MEKTGFRDFDLNLLPVFDALIRCGSVTQAAQELGMSQSAVSHALKRLRVIYNDSLFVRTDNKMTPTSRALAVATEVSQIVGLARSTLSSSASFDPRKSDRALTLAMGDAGDITILPVLQKYFREHGISCTLRSVSATPAEAIKMLETGRLTLYIGTLAVFSADIIRRKLYSDRLVAIASRRNPMGPRISIEEFTNAEHVLFSLRDPDAYRMSLDQKTRSFASRRKVRLETPYLISIPELIENDDRLISVMPDYIARFFARKHAIKLVELDFVLPEPEVDQNWHRIYHNDPFVIWARNLMHTLFGNGANNARHRAWQHQERIAAPMRSSSKVRTGSGVAKIRREKP